MIETFGCIYKKVKMNRRQLIISVFLAALPIMGGASLLEASDEQKPNIVFLLVDDLGWADVGYQGETFHTPNIDKLAEDGMLFTDAYAACPVCSPTRTSIITGKYPARVGLTCHIPSMGADWIDGRPKNNKEFSMESGVRTRNWLPETEVSIAETLKPLGYTSGFFGKWHLGHEPYHPDKQGFDQQTGTCNWGQPPSYDAPYQREWRKGDYYSIADLKNGAEPGEYLTDRLTEEVCTFISNHRNRPFLCYFSYYTVHSPLQPRKDLAHQGKYAAMITALDESVGRVLQTLERENLQHNTVVVFTSDNGSNLSNAPLRSKKGSTYEGGIRVPMVVRWPKVVKSGSTCNIPVISTDFFPTFVEIAGGNPRNTTAIDGVSVLPLMKGSQSMERESLYWHFPHREKIGLSGAIRKGNYKLIEHFSTGKIELYNLSKDKGEKNDLIEQLPEKARELLNDLIAWRSEVKALMPPDYETPNPWFRGD